MRTWPRPTDDDLKRWAQLRKTTATVLRQVRERGRAYKGAVGDLQFAYGRACIAVFPTADEAQVFVMRQWLCLVDAYCRNPPQMRAALNAALELALSRAGAILDGGPTGSLPPAAMSIATARRAAVQVRLPYADD